MTSTVLLASIGLAADPLVIPAPPTPERPAALSWAEGAWAQRHVDFGFAAIQVQDGNLSFAGVAPEVSFGVRLPLVARAGFALTLDPQVGLSGGSLAGQGYGTFVAPVHLGVGYGVNHAPGHAGRVGVGVGVGVTPMLWTDFGSAMGRVAPSLVGRIGVALDEPAFDEGPNPPVQVIELAGRWEAPDTVEGAAWSGWSVALHLQSYFPR